jgi:Tfp pilus assembly protein PilX
MTSVNKQSGAVMIVALVLLAIMFFVTTTALKTGVMEAMMTGNEQIRLETFERTQSIVESVISFESNFAASGSVGDTNCYRLTGCDASTVDLSSDMVTGDHDARTTVEITRLAPLYSPPPRSMASSAALFEVAAMQVEASYDGAADKLGKSTIGQGIMVVVRK